MNELTRYWIWLAHGIGFASPKAKRILSLYNNIKELYDGGEMQLRYCGIFTDNEIAKLCNTHISAADEIINKCDKLGYDILDISEDAYPRSLLCIEDPPAVLYVHGKMPDTDNLDTISVIGTRKATLYGIRTAFELGANLSSEGFVVVSGGALGIDCAAHRGVLQSDGITVCVLGCGIDFDYLRENKAMRTQIASKGAVISEYPPGTSASARNFPQRNRIISGLSQGLIVVEAPKASGSMITVNLALSQNKDVFSVMGNVDSPYSEGTNALIKDGAIPVTSYKDVIEFYRGVSNKSDNKHHFPDDIIKSVPSKLHNSSVLSKNIPVPTHKDSDSLTDEERQVYYILGLEPMHIDTIAETSGIPIYKVLRILSVLEMNDLIVNTEGRNYAIK